MGRVELHKALYQWQEAYDSEANDPYFMMFRTLYLGIVKPLKAQIRWQDQFLTL